MPAIISSPERQIKAARSVAVTPVRISTIRIALVRLDCIVASRMITPFVVAVGSPEVPYDTPALREWR